MTFMVLKYIKERYATPSEAGDILLMNLKSYFFKKIVNYELFSQLR